MDWDQRRSVQWARENKSVDDFFGGLCIKEVEG